MMRKFQFAVLACGVGLALGCGGESSDGEGNGGGGAGAGEAGAAVDTGLPEQAPLSSVTPEQYANACASLRANVQERLGPDRAVRGVCEVYEGALTDDPAQCRSSAESCVLDVNAGNGPAGITREQLDFTSFECGDTGDLQGCDVTVGELETCLDDRMTAIEQVLDGNDCANAASVSLATLTQLLGIGSTLPQSCSRLEQCPGLAPIVAPPAP